MTIRRAAKSMARPTAEESRPSNPTAPRTRPANDSWQSDRHPEISLPSAPTDIVASRSLESSSTDFRAMSQPLPAPIVTMQPPPPVQAESGAQQGSVMQTKSLQDTGDPGSPVVEEDVALLLELRCAESLSMPQLCQIHKHTSQVYLGLAPSVSTAVSSCWSCNT